MCQTYAWGKPVRVDESVEPHKERERKVGMRQVGRSGNHWLMISGAGKSAYKRRPRRWVSQGAKCVHQVVSAMSARVGDNW